MPNIWEARTKECYKDFPSAAEATAFVEAAKEGRVVMFADGKHSCGMWTFNRDGNGKWQSHYIWDGIGGPLADEAPH